MAHFEERSGIVQVDTPWGFWFQTIGEVFVEVDVMLCLQNQDAKALWSSLQKDQNPNQTKEDSSKESKCTPITGKEIKCTVTNKKIKLVVRGYTVFEGEFPQPVHADDSLWTLEDKKTIRICLSKARAQAGNVWPSLLVEQYVADAYKLDQMKRKQTLEQFQAENPGMDFSHSTISGNYEDGGPQMPS